MPEKQKPQDDPRKASDPPGEPEAQAGRTDPRAGLQGAANGSPGDAPAQPPAPDPRGRTPEDLAKGYARPHRDAVVHASCGQIVILRPDYAEAFARSPGVLGTIPCPHCRGEKRPVGEFAWQRGGEVVGT
jgi:hypothetical protein